MSAIKVIFVFLNIAQRCFQLGIAVSMLYITFHNCVKNKEVTTLMNSWILHLNTIIKTKQDTFMDYPAFWRSVYLQIAVFPQWLHTRIPDTK